MFIRASYVLISGTEDKGGGVAHGGRRGGSSAHQRRTALANHDELPVIRCKVVRAQAFDDIHVNVQRFGPVQ
jgi:hypothetical protein